MNSAAELKRHNDSASFNKARTKVIEALENDPLGLSVSQLMTVCRLGIKTVKEVLATIDVSEDQGIYFLKSQPPKIEKTHNQAPVIKDEKTTTVEKPVERRFGLQADLLQLLQQNKDGLFRSTILETLGITEKQFGKALWEIKKTHEIIRTGDFTCLHYQIADDTKSEDQPPVSRTTTQVDEFKAPSQDLNDGDKHMLVLNKAKSRIKTIVTTKYELDLCKGELTELLTNIFDLGQAEWMVVNGQLVGVRLSDVTAG